jgi:hypothetical protein
MRICRCRRRPHPQSPTNPNLSNRQPHSHYSICHLSITMWRVFSTDPPSLTSLFKWTFTILERWWFVMMKWDFWRINFWCLFFWIIFPFCGSERQGIYLHFNALFHHFLDGHKFIFICPFHCPMSQLLPNVLFPIIIYRTFFGGCFVISYETTFWVI